MGYLQALNSDRPLIAGNWKMNGLTADIDEALKVARALEAEPSPARVAICPPATLVAALAQALKDSPVAIGGQDCHTQAAGAFTGEVSAVMLADAGASLVILGHSERRTLCGETDAIVADKVLAALRAGLEPIICVGESAEERDAGFAAQRVRSQLRGSAPKALEGRAFAVAYEPIWAIGSGKSPTTGEIEAIHGAIRETLADLFGGEAERTPILYGGSVKGSNAGSILQAQNVGGVLVGGASLKAADFLSIIHAA